MTLQFAGLPLESNWRSIESRRVLHERLDPIRESDEIVTCFRDGQVTLRSNRRVEGFTNAIKEHGYKAVEPGDLVVHSMDAFAGAIGVSDSRGKMSPVAGVYEVPDGDSRFIAYYLRACAWSGLIQSLAKGIRERSTSFDRQSLAGLRIPDRPLEEQRRIADFLDDQVTRIDALVQLRRLELDQILLGQKGAIAQAAWEADEFIPLSRIADVRVSNINKHQLPGETPVSLCNYQDIYYRDRICGDQEFMQSTASTNQIFKFELATGDVLFTKDSETADDIAIAAYVESTFSGLVLGYHCGLARPLTVHGSYLYWMFRSDYVRQQLTVSATGVTRVGLKLSALRSCLIPVVPSEEQQRVADRLWDLSDRVNTVLDLVEFSIATLIERKRALITAAVTGQLDVATARPIAITSKSRGIK